jgi:CRISPR-associated protein Cpf1
MIKRVISVVEDEKDLNELVKRYLEKEGYLSQVIHKITQLMIKYNAIVVLEDLNPGFMRGRQKVDN